MSMVDPMARTTPRTSAEIHESAVSLGEIARTYNISRSTARKWRNRSVHLDRSHRAYQMRTNPRPAQELTILEIRHLCMRPLDNLVCDTRDFISTEAIHSVISRLLRREGFSKLAVLVQQQAGKVTPKKKTFKDYELGYVHIDIKYLHQMPDESSRRYLFVAIDRATRWVFLRIYSDQTERSSVDFLHRDYQVVAFKVVKLLTDNGTQFFDCFTSKKNNPWVSMSLINSARCWRLSTVCRHPCTPRLTAWSSASMVISARSSSKLALHYVQS
jgi:hypothetical protein